MLHTERSASEDLLAEYARRFAALEMDSTFVRFPSRSTIASWAHVTPASFTINVRMSREVTHVGRLAVPDAVCLTVDALAPLGPRLGCVLFSTPSSMVCDVDALQAVLDRIPEGVPTAWEFHHPSWLCPEAIDLLVDHGSAPVIVDRLDGVSGEELLPGGVLADKWDLPFLYVRLRRDRYGVDDVLDWGEILGEAVRGGRCVHAFFKQSLESAGYALALAELLGDAERSS